MREITEALLEMHYHHAFVAAFEAVFGARFLRLLKPSSRAEKWVGFDQGWVRTTVSTSALMQELRGAISGTHGAAHLVLGYFMQFKVVAEKTRRSTSDPDGISLPYFRAKLDLRRDDRTGLSQHETLLRLANLPKADVSYCCPFLFDLDRLYEEASLEEVQVVGVGTSPAGWANTAAHYIVFRHEGDESPLWCSEAVGGSAMSARRWVDEASRRIVLGFDELGGLITGMSELLHGRLDESFTLVELVPLAEPKETASSVAKGR